MFLNIVTKKNVPQDQKSRDATVLYVKNHGSVLIVRQDLLKNTYISDAG